jgi:hypothetical protein
MSITLPIHDTDNTNVILCQVRLLALAELEPQAAGARGWATYVFCFPTVDIQVLLSVHISHVPEVCTRVSLQDSCNACVPIFDFALLHTLLQVDRSV